MFRAMIALLNGNTGMYTKFWDICFKKISLPALTPIFFLDE